MRATLSALQSASCHDVLGCIVAASNLSVSLANRGIKDLFPRNNIVTIETSNAMVVETINHQPYHMTV